MLSIKIYWCTSRFCVANATFKECNPCNQFSLVGKYVCVRSKCIISISKCSLNTFHPIWDILKPIKPSRPRCYCLAWPRLGNSQRRFTLNHPPTRQPRKLIFGMQPNHNLARRNMKKKIRFNWPSPPKTRFFSLFLFSFSYTYFSPRRGYHRVPKFCMGF